MREIVQSYITLCAQAKTSALFVDFTEENRLLVQMGLLDSALRLTVKGNIALQSGCEYPFYIAEYLALVQQGSLPWDKKISAQILAGFVELAPDEKPLLMDEFMNRELYQTHQQIEECIAPLRKQLHWNGIAPSEPSSAQSALMQAVKSGKSIASIAAQSGRSVEAIIRLIQQTRVLAFQFADFLNTDCVKQR